MKISDNLALTIDVGAVKAYSTPVSREVFEANFKIISATKAALFSGTGKSVIQVSPVIAALTLKDEGRKLADEAGDEEGDGGASALIAEIKRLTVILAPGADGWDMLPVDTAIQSGAMDAEEWGEALSELVFFTVSYTLARKADRKAAAEGLCSITNLDMSSLSAEEFMASLPTSTMADPTPKKAASSVPV
jgi:hypothetical protein